MALPPYSCSAKPTARTVSYRQVRPKPNILYYSIKRLKKFKNWVFPFVLRFLQNFYPCWDRNCVGYGADTTHITHLTMDLSWKVWMRLWRHLTDPSWLGAHSCGLCSFLMGTGWKNWAQRLPRMTKTEKIPAATPVLIKGVWRGFDSSYPALPNRRTYIYVCISYTDNSYIKEEAFMLSKSDLKLILPVVCGNWFRLSKLP